MKTLKSNFYILFTLAFILSSCSQSSEDIEIISSKDLIEAKKNTKEEMTVNYIDIKKPDILNEDKLSARRGSSDCCKDCKGSVTIEEVTSSGSWNLEMYVSCDTEPAPFFENLRLVNTWTSQVHTTDVAYEIDILDEHNYFFLWSGPSSEITVSNGPNVYPLPPSFDFTAAPGSLTHLNLYCDGYTTRNCWIGGKRICCLPQVE